MPGIFSIVCFSLAVDWSFMVLPNFLNQIKSAIDHEYKRTLYRNLVFKGGGVRGIAYMGALEVLDKYRIVENIQRVAGTIVN